MEKQNEHHRSSSASLTVSLPAKPKTKHVAQGYSLPTMSPASPLRAARPPLCSPSLPRSQTLPNLLPDVHPLERPGPSPPELRISISQDDDGSRTEEICLSPSWSDHGEKQRKKERKRIEREIKDLKKQTKSEEDKRKFADTRAGKRLTKKPPPAAMETQKMPSALRRNSFLSFISGGRSSGESSRRSSLSVSSIGLDRCSLSTPGTSTDLTRETHDNAAKWRDIVSPSAPKIPSFSWISRKGSNASSKSLALKNDDASLVQEGDLIAFAYRLDASTIMNEPEKISNPRLTRAPTVAVTEIRDQSPTHSSISSRHDPAKDLHERSPGDIVQYSSAPEDEICDRSLPGTSIESHRQDVPALAELEVKNVEEDLAKMMVNQRQKIDSNSSLAQRPQLPTRSSHDGSSYVHKQRMHQQQLSIAGFEDQQAVQDANDLANELAAEYEALLESRPSSVLERGRPLDSSQNTAQTTESVNLRDGDLPDLSSFSKPSSRSNSPHFWNAYTNPSSRTSTPHSQATDEIQVAVVQDKQSVKPLQSVRDLVSLSKPQATSTSRADKILGFRQRSKQPPSFNSTPYSPESKVVTVESSLPETPSCKEVPSKRSKIERILGEPRPMVVQTDRRDPSGSLAESSKKEIGPQAKRNLSHSRTRTASSTALPESTQSPKVLLRSPTEPVQGLTDRPVRKQALETVNNQQAHANKSAEIASKPRKECVKPANNHLDLKSSLRSATDGKSTNKVVKIAVPTRDVDDSAEEAKKLSSQVIVKTETADGLIRQTSITRARSTPQLELIPATKRDTPEVSSINQTPSLDFLPTLKHQPLVKRERQSPTRPQLSETKQVSMAQFTPPLTPTSYQSPSPSSPDLTPDLKAFPRSPLRPPSQFPVQAPRRHLHRSTTEVGTTAIGPGNGALAEGLDAKPVAKLFVICCKCKFWHDLPSKLYEAMASPKELQKEEKGNSAGARLDTEVKCPWCEHAMTTWCCQGWTTVVYLHERHH